MTCVWDPQAIDAVANLAELVMQNASLPIMHQTDPPVADARRYPRGVWCSAEEIYGPEGELAEPTMVAQAMREPRLSVSMVSNSELNAATR